MPGGKLTGEQKAEVARRYQAGETATALAEAFGVSKSCLCRHIKAMGIPARAFSPYSAKAIACPYSAARLREMYWREAMSLPEIGARAAQLLGREKPVFQKTLLRWFADAGIAVRTLTEAQRVRAKNHPEQFAAPVAAMQVAPRNVEPQRLTKRIQRMGRKAAAEKKRRERPFETRRCAYCKTEVTRPAIYFRHPPENTFCSVACANRARKLRRIEAVKLEAARQANPELAAYLTGRE